MTTGHVSLRCKIQEYDNIYLVMWSIEQIFTNNLHKSPCPPEGEFNIYYTLNRSLLIKLSLNGVSQVHISFKYKICTCKYYNKKYVIEKSRYRCDGKGHTTV